MPVSAKKFLVSAGTGAEILVVDAADVVSVEIIISESMVPIKSGINICLKGRSLDGFS